MSQTFIASSDTISSYQNTVVAGSVAMEERNPNRAHFALFNMTGSNQVVKIREISVSPMNFQGVTRNTVDFSLITGHWGGKTVVPFKLDSGNASFPSTVEIRTNSDRINVVTGRFVKVMLQPSSFLGVTVGYPFAKKNLLNRWMDATTPEAQKVILRNGEGFSITEPNYPNTYSFPCIINATIRLSDTGACYQLTGFADANSNAIFTVFNNGYTAGQVEILKIEIDSVRGGTAVGTTGDVIPYHTVALLDGFSDVVNGEAITPKSMDSVNSLNSYIKLYKNLDVGYFYARTGNLATNALMFRTVPQSSRINTPIFTPWKKIIFNSSGSENDLIIREGGGVAVLQPDAGAYGSSYTIDVVFTQDSVGGDVVISSSFISITNE